MAFWNAAQSSGDCDAVRAYMQRFPRGIFIELAKLSERRLCSAGRKVSVVEPAAAEAASSSVAAATLTPAAPPSPPAPDAKVTAAKAAPIAVAAAPDATNVAPPSTRVPVIAPSATELTRAIQLELYRLGCGNAEADGKWTVVTREGLRKFSLRTKAKLDTSEPSSALVVALQKHAGRVCPLECARGTVARGETCVAVAKPEPKPKAKPSRRAERNTRSAAPVRVREREREPAPAAAAAAPQPAVAPMMMPMGGMMFFGFGRRRF
jgi:hypothetical protein